MPQGKVNEKSLEQVLEIVQAMYDKSLENADEHKKALKEMDATASEKEREHLVLLGQAYGLRNMCEFLIKFIDNSKKGQNTMDATRNANEEMLEQTKELKEERLVDETEKGGFKTKIRVTGDDWEEVEITEKDSYWMAAARAGDDWLTKTEDIFIKTLNKDEREKVCRFISEQTIILASVLKASDIYQDKHGFAMAEAEKLYTENMSRFSAMFKRFFKKELGDELWKKFVKATADTNGKAPKNCFIFDIEKEIRLL